MNIKQKILCIAFGCYPMIAFAEVSDKVQSIPSALLLGGGSWVWNDLFRAVPVVAKCCFTSYSDSVDCREYFALERNSHARGDNSRTRFDLLLGIGNTRLFYTNWCNCWHLFGI